MDAPTLRQRRTRPGERQPRTGRRLLVAAVVAAVVAPVAPVGLGPVTATSADLLPAGALDPTFADDGIAISELDSNVDPLDSARIAEGPEAGKVLVLSNIGVWRLLPDGTLDTAFGRGGVAEVGSGSLMAIAVHPGGEAYVVMVRTFSGACPTPFLGIARFDADGRPDADFGNNGFACVNWPELQFPRDVAVQADGRVLITGGATPDNNTERIALARLSADGQNLDGTVMLAPPEVPVLAQHERGQEIAIQSDGAIVIVAHALPQFPFPDDPRGVRVARFLPDSLELDQTFGDDGIAQLETPGFWASNNVAGIALWPPQGPGGDPVQQIAVAIQEQFGEPRAIRLMRWDENGDTVGDPVDTPFDDPDITSMSFKDLVTSPRGFAALAVVGFEGGPRQLATVAYDASELDLEPSPTFVQHPDGDLDLGSAFRPVTVAMHLPEGPILVAGSLQVSESFERRLVVTRIAEVASTESHTLDLEPTFGDAGFVVHRGGSADVARVVAVQPDRRVLIAGNSSGFDGFVLRHLEDGSLDPSFGGPAGALFGREHEGVTFVELDIHGLAHVPADDPGEDTVVVVGRSFDESDSPAVHRLLADGSPDPDFNGGDPVFAVLSDLPDDFGHHVFRSVAVQPDGRIVAAGDGTEEVECDSDGCHVARWVFVARFLPDGSLDPSFGEDVTGDGELDGYTRIGPVDGFLDFSGATSNVEVLGRGNAVQLQPDGAIVLTGWLSPPPEDEGGGQVPHVLVARLAPDGSRDPTFAVGQGLGFGPGVLLDGVPGVDDFGYDVLAAGGNDVALRADGGIVVAGFAVVCSGSDPPPVSVAPGPGFGACFVRQLTLQYLSTGERDPAYLDGGALLWAPAEDVHAEAHGVSLDAVGDAVIAGTVGATTLGLGATTGDLLLLRAVPTGEFDPGFGTDGVIETDAGGSESGHDVAIAPDGKILVVGSTLDGRGERALAARYLPGLGLLECAPLAIDFGAPLVGGSVSQVATCTVSAGTVRVDEVRVEPPNPVDFDTPLDTCTEATLRVGETCTVTARFAPQAAGVQEGALVVEYTGTQGSGQLAEVDLRGTTSTVDPVATLTVDPEEGPVETEVEVTGEGYDPGVAVQLLLDDVPVGEVPAGEVTATGFTATFEVPEGTPGGDRTVSGCQRCGTADELLGTATFTVTPRLFLNRDLARGGEVIEATGDGFPADTPVSLRWDQGLGVTTTMADDDGLIRTGVLLFRRDLTGPRELQARISLAEDVVAEAAFLVVPGSAQPGDFAVRR